MSPGPLSPPIPSEIWTRLLAFLREGKTGQISLHVHQGKVRDATFEERIRAPVVDSRP